MVTALVQFALALAAAPLLVGVINRTKAVFAGRRGQPLLQLYHDLAKLLGKGAVYSTTATPVILAAPLVGLAAVLAATAIVPLGGRPGLIAFPGDFLLLAGLLALARFATVISALDTGSSFEGMGAAREAFFSALAEPALLLGLAALAIRDEQLSLAGFYAAVTPDAILVEAGPAMFLVAAAFLAVFLAENARIPVDDPNTHLELTMIHEVMVLDHSGPDFALIQYAAALKLWLLGSLIVGILVPVRTEWWACDLACGAAGLAALAVLVGVIESTLARLRLVRVPQFLVAAGVLSVLALVLLLK